MEERGYGELSAVVAPHGFHDTSPRVTIEQKLLFYADKRVMIDRVVSLEERFADFARRYGNGRMSDEARAWYEEVRKVECDLFVADPP